MARLVNAQGARVSADEPLAPGRAGGAPGSGSQTLDRGLEVLERVVAADRPLTLTEVAAATGLGRSVAYRLLRTLEDRGLISLLDGQGYAPGMGLLRLVPPARQSIVEAARPVLAQLATDVGATTLLSVRDRDDVVLALCIQPGGNGPFITYREGAAAPLGRGASSLAILALHPPRPGERDVVTEARAAGPFAVVRTVGELRPGTAGLAVAWPGPPDMALAVVFFDGTLDEGPAATALVAAGQHLSRIPRA